MKTSFKTQIQQTGNNTGIEVPEKNVMQLGTSKKPAVMVSVSGYTYHSTVAVMGEKYMIPLSKAHREASGLKGGDKVDVTLELETTPRSIEVPKYLAEALAKAGLRESFDASAPSKRKEFVRQVEEAKSQETRERRVEKVIAGLRES